MDFQARATDGRAPGLNKIVLILVANIAGLALTGPALAQYVVPSGNHASLPVDTDGNVTQTGAIAVFGTSSINAGTGSITLTNAANDFVGAVSASGANISITDLNALTVGTLNAGPGIVSLTAAGGVTATGAITANQAQVNGNLKFAAGSTFNVVIDPLSSANSLITVTGNVDINGGTVAHIGGAGSFLRTTRVILTTQGTLTGTFAEKVAPPSQVRRHWP